MHVDAIHREVMRDNINRVRLLLTTDKTRLDSRNPRGATPLMLASLYGHVRIVKALIQRKASVDIRDYKGRRAEDYARGGHYARSQSRLYRRRFPLHIKSAGLKKNREHIFNLLSSPAALQEIAAEQTFAKLIFFKHDRTFGLLKARAMLKYGRKLKESTVAYIASRGKDSNPEMCAVSGWLTPSPPTPGVLDNAKYTQLVRQAITLLGRKVVPAAKDNGNHGVWFACHAEKKLAIYWVLKQMQYALEIDDLSRMRELKKVSLPDHRKRATIYLDHLCCVDCAGFVDAIYKETGIDINLVQNRFVHPGRRGNNLTPDGYCPRCPCRDCEKKKKDHEAQCEQQDQPIPVEQSDQHLVQGGCESLPSEGAPSQSDGQESDIGMSSIWEDVGEPTPPEPYELHKNRIGRVPTITPPPIRLSDEWDRFGDGQSSDYCRKPPNGDSGASGSRRRITGTIEQPSRPIPPASTHFGPSYQRYNLQSQTRRQLPLQSVRHQRRCSSSYLELSSLPDPFSYQDGQSAYFGGEVEVVSPPPGLEASQPHGRSTPRRFPSRGGTPSTASSSVHTSSSRRSWLKRKRDIQNVISSLKLKERFTYKEKHQQQRKPPPPLPLARRAQAQKQPVRPNGGGRHRETGQRNQALAGPRKRRAARRPREEALASRSTLRANLNFRQQIQRRTQGPKAVSSPHPPATYDFGDDESDGEV